MCKYWKESGEARKTLFCEKENRKITYPSVTADGVLGRFEWKVEDGRVGEPLSVGVSNFNFAETL